MGANKTAPTKVTVKTFIDALPDETTRSDAKLLVKWMQNATGEKAKMWGPSIIGCGTRHYVYDSGREGDTPLIGFSPRKVAHVLYGLKAAKDHEALLTKLGKHSTGKGCVYIKRLSDIDQTVLQTLIVNSVTATRAR